MVSEEPSSWQGRIPADIDRAEPVLFNLTARQCLIIAPVLVGAWGAYLLLRETVPLWVFALALAPVLGVAIAVALGERDGRGLERVAASALAWARSPKHLVGAPSGEIPQLPRWVPRLARAPRLAPLRLPASAITPEGVIDLGGRCAVMIFCTTLPFQLASGREQDQTLAAFAGVVDALSEPVQVLVQRRKADLSSFTAMVRDNTSHLPHRALAEAAVAHADFLDELARTHELSHQQVVVVVTATGPAHRAGAALRRTAQDTADRLATLGIRTYVLGGVEAEQLLRQAMAAPGQTVTDSDPGADARSDTDIRDEHAHEREGGER
ncbi:PrgI family protein [Nocardiopsis sp. EMB25]|uniref:PrgI family protein n=1 Tax=Nocardiopsis sp. EMB25 TaxID=2835867 RepID=UPI00228459FC|nr:PrgI family protein [Nocardiopsis sp. EMB25]MCY9785188.1 PrgI family protein [Nocardiopsis sp. EMB25]